MAEENEVTMSKTVREYYNITEDDMNNLEMRSCCNKYFADSRWFMRRVIDNQISNLSDGQIAWIEQILDRIQ